MSAELLRRAAALMRSRAEAATTHTPWQLLEDDDYAPPWTVASTHPEGERTWVCKDARHTGEHIASWHPVVALAVADMLDHTAEADEQHRLQLGRGIARGRMDAALAVARAYLGADGD